MRQHLSKHTHFIYKKITKFEKNRANGVVAYLYLYMQDKLSHVKKFQTHVIMISSHFDIVGLHVNITVLHMLT